jgi:hypothetical protein
MPRQPPDNVKGHAEDTRGHASGPAEAGHPTTDAENYSRGLAPPRTEGPQAAAHEHAEDQVT